MLNLFQQHKKNYDPYFVAGLIQKDIKNKIKPLNISYTTNLINQKLKRINNTFRVLPKVYYIRKNTKRPSLTINTIYGYITMNTLRIIQYSIYL